MTKKPVSKKPVVKPGSKPKRSRITLLIIAIVGAVGAFFVISFYQTKYQQQQSLKQLSEASSKIRPIYEKLLELNQGNIAESYFRNECHEQSVKYGRGEISCGSSGEIYIRNRPTLQDLNGMISDAIQASNANGSRMVYQSETEASYDLDVGQASVVSCYISYGETIRDLHSYSIYCTKQVPDFLPGYEIIR